MIELTGAGRELAGRLQLESTIPPAAFASLSASEIVTLRDLLRKLDSAGT